MKKSVSLFHNPEAGDSSHSKKDLQKQITDAGFDVVFSTTDPCDVKKVIPARTDYVAIAGGDGMVRKVVTEMLKRPILEGLFTIGVIPLGTANNIARALNLPLKTEDAINSWKNGHVLAVDVGRISGSEDQHFFLEGIGCGLMALMMKEMKERKSKSSQPQEEIEIALDKLLKLSRKAKPFLCSIEVDEKIYKGKVLAVQVMNTKTIGPNVPFSPNANTSDGQFEVVYVTEDQRKELVQFLEKLQKSGKNGSLKAEHFLGKKVKLTGDEILFHIDDKLEKPRDGSVLIENRKGLLEFLVPAATDLSKKFGQR